MAVRSGEYSGWRSLLYKIARDLVKPYINATIWANSSKIMKLRPAVMIIPEVSVPVSMSARVSIGNNTARNPICLITFLT